ncbi:hypothetical protein HFO93_10870 [Rhizobium leguminosarum]|uniref:hypothetical protein n=1 Tax=Rhizobium TaxID=379 RepID=UPI001C984B9B|nr:hypothetical protein [Rhizobium leguminosarum]MBY5443973.1 hypothetical protein [Rhizobium leguminosarum]
MLVRADQDGDRSPPGTAGDFALDAWNELTVLQYALWLGCVLRLDLAPSMRILAAER